MINSAMVLAYFLLYSIFGGLVLSEEVCYSQASVCQLNDAMFRTIERVFRMAPHVKEPKTADDTATAFTTSGEVTGTLFDDSTVFYGIPYAEKPVRFMESELRAAREPIDASKPSNVTCFQTCVIQCRFDRTPTQSEDCLILNVYVPHQLKKQNARLLPVLFWIHGGAFLAGSGTDPWYDGHWLSRATNTVVVTINYRLGALGFFTYKGEGLSGNQGIGDQQLALKWVQLNIDKFGGDKSQVTIFGQNAGAQSVMLHLVSKKSAPYFKRAIMQSNPAVVRYRTEDETQDNTDIILKETNCDSLKCLQEISAKSIVDLHTQVAVGHPAKTPFGFQSFSEEFFNLVEPFRPVTGGLQFPEQPMSMLHHGRWNTDKQVIVGHTADEMSVFREILESKLHENKKATTRASHMTHKRLKGLVRLFMLQLNVKHVVQNVLTTFFFACPSRNLARFLEQSGEKPDNVFFYKFKYGPALEFANARDYPEELAGKAFHGSELAFLFGNEPNGYTFTDDDLVMRDMLNNYWGNFSHSGRPGDGLQWPPYQKSPKLLKSWPRVELDIPESSVTFDYYDLCSLLNFVGVYSNIDPPFR